MTSLRDYASGEPQLMSVLGNNCASCDSTTVPLYDLLCHESDDSHCRDCLTKKWYGAIDDVVRCPHSECGQDAGFMPLFPLSSGLYLSNSFYDADQIEKIRQQPEVMNNLMGYTREEAEVALQHIYSLFEDQILDPVALGGVLGYITEHAQNSLQANIDFNSFYTGLLQTIKSAPKFMTTPLQLQEDLNAVLDALLYQYAKLNYENELSRWRIDMSNQDAVLDAAGQNYKSIKDLTDYWIEIIQKTVDLLAWRHLERVSPPEGGAVERQY